VVLDQLVEAGTPPGAIVLEPVARNTAPAAITAALLVEQEHPGAIMALLPSDHVIRDMVTYREVFDRAIDAAVQGYLVTFGIVVDRPEVGFGYLRRGEAIKEAPGALRVAAFVEKPDVLTASKYISSGEYFWNSGMFVMKAATLIEEATRLCPDIVSACRGALSGSTRDLDFLRLHQPAFSRARSISIDYAVMEGTERAAVVPADIGWSDAGAWHSVWGLSDKDMDGNAVIGGRSYLEGTTNCYFRSEDGRLLVGLGLNDLTVVSTRDAVLVLPNDRAPEVGKLVERLRQAGHEETVAPPVVHRPWGTYEDLDQGAGFRVKRIVVKSGGQLSLQYHRHRSEHWVVVAGKALVTRGGEEIVLHPNESIHIPLGETHRLENPYDEPLILIEVQCGTYLGEDDIIRVEDRYGRSVDPEAPKSSAIAAR